MRGTFFGIGTEFLVGLLAWLETVSRLPLGIPIPGLVSRPVVALSLENKGFGENKNN